MSLKNHWTTSDRSGSCLSGRWVPVFFLWTFATVLLRLSSVTSAVGGTGQGPHTKTERLLLPDVDVSQVPYSKEWMGDMLAFGTEGECIPVPLIYTWRNVGWGSNINQILAQWLEQCIFKGTYNFALNVSPWFIRSVNCSSAHGASQTVRGLECIFQPMTRLCVLDDEEQKWEFVDSGSRVDGTQTPSLPKPSDKVETAAALLAFIYANAQPWFTKDVEAITTTGNVAKMRSGKYIAIHVRRGDKLLSEAVKIEVQVYLEAAALYLWQSSGNHIGVDSISGIWVSSDDKLVLAEVQQLAPKFFPNVAIDDVITISFRTPTPGKHNGGDELPTTANYMTYELYVGLHAELRVLSEADVFVGTFSSNIARLVYLMRETNGFLRNSTISLDQRHWHLG